MTKRTSPSKKIYYANGATRKPINKRKRIVRHLKKQPNDLQAKGALNDQK